MLATRMRQAAAEQQTGGGAALSAPTGLTATADGGYARIRLVWTDNSTGEDGHKIERSPDGSTGWTQIATTPEDQEFYVDTGLTRGNTYYYRVRAYEGANHSAYSSTANATVFALSDFTYRVLLDADTDVYTDLAGTTPVASDGDLVRRWNNQGTIGGYFDVAADTNRPTWQDAEINSKASLRFATDDFLKDGANTASTWKFLHDGSGYSIVVVHKSTSTDPNALGLILDTGGAATANHGFSFGYDDRSASSRLDCMIAYMARGGAYLANPISRRVGARAGAWHVTGFRYDNGLGSANARIDNDGEWGAKGVANKSGTPSASNPTSYLRIGAYYTGAFFFNGDIAFIAITDSALSDADYRKLQEYAAEEYGGPELHWFDTPVVIEHDTSEPDHNGFPGLCVAANGDLVMAYNVSTSHTAFDGTLVIRKSTDKGDTWGSESTLWDYSTDGGGTDLWLVGGLTTLSDGRIILTVGKRVSGGLAVDGIGYFESSDNGDTWSSLTTLNASLTDFAAEGGGVYELGNGDLLFPFYGQDTGDGAAWSCMLLRSTDGGSSWGSEVTVVDGVANSKQYAEPGFFEIGSTLYALVRNNTLTSMDYATSTDNGATWSAVTVGLSFTSGRMNPLALSTGEVVTAIRWLDVASKPCGPLFTRDGAIYQVGELLAESPNFTDVQMAYGQYAQGPDDTVYLVYSQEGTSNAVADIMFTKAER